MNTMVPAENTPLVRFSGVQKTYDGSILVVSDLNLDIQKGEFLSLLGPSGSGKTTTLMMLAGFESPTAGEISLNGASITRTPPHKRNFGMVFQNYALFPHLTVAENIAYPLTVRKLGKADREAKVKQALDMVQMGPMGDRYPAQLSGGQQQRVALARALVFDPQLVLMDEPLGALDKQLREHMQLELKSIHRQLGITFVYVTHAQREGKNLKITWTGGIYDLDYWVMPKGTPNKEAALKFIAMASSPDAQAEYARNISYGPTNTKALAKLDAKVLSMLPSSPANSKTALQFNVGFWADQGEALEKRFTAWAAQ